MKSAINKMFLLSITLSLSNLMSAQDTVPKKSSKEVIEKTSGENIHSRKIRQKQLYAAPAVVECHDSLSIRKSKALKKKKK